MTQPINGSESILTIKFDHATGNYLVKREGNFQIPSLVGTLEMVKANLVLEHLAMVQQAAQKQAQRGIVLPGGPVPR